MRAPRGQGRGDLKTLEEQTRWLHQGRGQVWEEGRGLARRCPMGEGPKRAMGGVQTAVLHSSLSFQGRSELLKTPTSAKLPGSWPQCPPLSCVSNWLVAATPPMPSTSASLGRKSTAPVGGTPNRPCSTPSRVEAVLSKFPGWFFA